MKAFMMAQYTPEWWEVRRGLPTASEFDKILTPGGKLSAQARKYAIQLCSDAANLNPNAFSDRRIGTPAMEQGRQAEPDARRFYAMERNCDVQEVGFVLSPCGRFGCSPDGLVNFRATGRGEASVEGLEMPWWEGEADGMLELKCPLPETHGEYVLQGPDYLPAEYRPQVHGQLIVTGLPWVDFLSYVRRMPTHLVRVEATAYTDQLRKALDEFIALYADVALKLLGYVPNRWSAK